MSRELADQLRGDRVGTIAPGNSPRGLDVEWGGAFTFSGLRESTPFHINILSLNGTDPDEFGPLAGLAPNTTQTWQILEHSAAITRSHASNFNLTARFFASDFFADLFTLELRDGDTNFILIRITGASWLLWCRCQAVS